MNFRELIVDMLCNAIDNIDSEEIASMIEVPPRSDMGDFAFPCFRLAKVYRKSPNLIAEEIASQLNIPDYIESVKTMGAYINFYIDKASFVEVFFKDFESKDNYGSSDEGEGKTIVLDYSSPNVAKPFHIGHFRTTIIGNALYKIYEFLGYNCVGVNHLGDWGTQFGKLIVAYKKWGSKELVEQNGIEELVKIYVKFHDEAEKDDSLNDEARAWFTKMENGDQEALELWQWFKDISLKEFKKIYDLLDIQFDSYAGESFYNDKMASVIKEIEEKGLIMISEGAKIVKLEDENMPPCLITKKDGSTLYSTRDITAAIYRKNTYDFHKCLYVTAFDQKLHFAQWFKVIEKMGYEWHKDLIHVPYGLVSMESGKLSTRKGQVILLKDLLGEAIDKTRKIIEDKNPNLDNKEYVSKIVGIGAIIFNDLYNNIIKDVVFTWDKVLNFDGETGPYVQYTHARAASVLNKAGFTEFKQENINYDLLTDLASYKLVKRLTEFPGIIKTAADKLEPSFIPRYIVDLAQDFNKFYHDNPIIVDDKELKNARLSLVYMTKKVISDGLKLIGMEAPEKM